MFDITRGSSGHDMSFTQLILVKIAAFWEITISVVEQWMPAKLIFSAFVNQLKFVTFPQFVSFCDNLLVKLTHWTRKSGGNHPGLSFIWLKLTISSIIATRWSLWWKAFDTSALCVVLLCCCLWNFACFVVFSNQNYKLWSNLFSA